MIKISKNRDIRNTLALKYIRGRGIEIGALNNPLKVPPNVQVSYVDRLDDEGIVNHYPEIADGPVITADIIDDAEKLENIPDYHCDFCIANHVLEHMRDPIGAVLTWLRILKPGGILFISVPSVNNPKDSGRSVTDLAHICRDYHEPDEKADYEHFREFYKACHKLEDSGEIDTIARKNFERKYSIHYHTFSRDSLEELLSWMMSRHAGLFKIREMHENAIPDTVEYICIIEKDTYHEKIRAYLPGLKDRKNTDNIDVILPVYNAYDDLLKCLCSLLHHHSGYRIIIIDDKSTDSRIGTLLGSLREYENDSFVVLENEANLGFVGTVNRGMKFSQNDIILLNSDTIVTAGWAEKIKNCAYSDPKIATVTPLTNNGTICSVPVFLQDNPLPEGFTVDTFAKMVEEISLHQFLEIPTAVGFCMFIKRDVCKEIGYFDEETFGRGYAEENDFSRRAVARGFTNVLCDSTFIYHRGSSSFSDVKKELYDKNLEILSKRYPDYLATVARFCSSNPLKEIQKNIQMRMMTYDIADKNRRVLMVLHTMGGGTYKYAMDMIMVLNRYYVFYILQVSENTIILEEFNNGKMVRYSFPIGHFIDMVKPHDPEYSGIVKGIISSFKINLIHIHHLYGHPLDIFTIAGEMKIPLLMTIHDYYTVCPSIFPVNEEGIYCSDLHDITRCNRCLSIRQKRHDGFITEWRSNIQAVIHHVTIFIANNRAVMEIINTCYSIPPEKMVIIEPGHSHELIRLSRKRSAKRLCTPVRFAYIGVLERSHKGMDMFYSLAASPRLKHTTKWKLIGVSELHEKPGFYPDCNIEVYGKFRDFRDLSNALKDVDIVIHPGPGETYSYTISEAWANGIPVLGADVGVSKARIEMTGGGWLTDVCDLKKTEDRILEIIREKPDYDQKIRNVQQIQLNTMAAFSRDYRLLYDSIQKGKHPDIQPGFSRQSVYEAIASCDSSAIPVSDSLEILDPNFGLPVHEKFIKCFREHGLLYTIRRVVIFVRDISYHRSSPY